MKTISKLLLQYLLPQHIVSRLAGFVADSHNKWLKNLLIKIFISHYKINMNEASESQPQNYPTFNSFFTRTLKDGARPIAKSEKVIISPADGTISQIGKIEKKYLLQAKNRTLYVTKVARRP